MYGILFRVEAKPGRYEELRDFLKWDAEVAKDKEPGTLRFEFYRDATKNAFYVYEAYRDRNAFKEHQQNEPYQRWLSIQNELCANFSKLFDDEAVSSTAG